MNGLVKRVLFVMVFALCMMVIAACSGEEDNGGEVTEPDENFNETGLPIVDEQIEIDMVAFAPDSREFEDFEFFQKAEEDTNIKINWDLQQGGSSWQEKRSILFAGSDLPDAFYGHGILDDKTDVVKYGSQGLLIPLEDLIEEYAPNIQKILENEQYRKELTAPDGHIYSLPTINEDYAQTKPALFINKDWLDQLDLPLPTTTEEFYETLKAFKENELSPRGKSKQIGLTFRSDDWNANLNSFFGAFGRVTHNDHIAIEDDKVINTAIQPEFKEAIKYFEKLFDEGLVDRESFTQDPSDFSAKINQADGNNVGAFIAWNTNSVDLEEDNNFVPLEPLIGPNGDQKWGGFVPGINLKGSFVITSENPNPAETIRWIDYMYEPLNSLQVMHGVIGENLEEQDDGTYLKLSPPEGVDPEDFQTSPKTKYTVWALDEEMGEKLTPEKEQKLSKEDLDEIYEPYLDFNEFPKAYFTPEETERISEFATDINEYIDSQYAEWMVKGGIDEEWDDYLKKLDDMGLEEMMSIYEEVYERYNEAE
ncbi:MAG TPA: sugar ABC transporter substrate-binding protein [Pseudogracilibacillus sp.]|nr:sugar ABC transporter substrate-binding protein [Pseudogracilibacillus sp.]